MMDKHFLTDPDKLLIRKNGQELILLMRFSDTLNVATRFIEGNENSYFLPAEAPMEDIFQGCLFAECWDNAAPLWTSKHSHIGGNHGSPFAFRIHLLRHWLFESDTGKVLVDDAGNRFVLVSVDSLSDFTIHSDIPETYGEFCKKVTGNLHLEGKTIIPETVTRGQLAQPPGGQIAPHKRYSVVKLMADGVREITDGETVECSFAELHWEFDLIFPEALLEFLKKHPGKYISPTDPRLDATLHSNMITTFYSRCARTVEGNVVFLKDIPESVTYGMLQFYGGIGFTDHERLVPGFKTVEEAGLTIDFAGICRFPDKFPVAHFFTKKECTDPEKLPCRYIDFFGNNGKRELGVVLGYSLTQGITARGNESERSNSLLYLCSTKKCYPFAYESPETKAGKKIRICAYQQYFQPDVSGVSCFHHQEPDGYYIYADFPSFIERYAVKLPAFLAGKAVELVESDPGIEWTGSLKSVPENGCITLHASGRGGIVLRVNQKCTVPQSH